MAILQDFIDNFHSINGITIGERRKELFKLLNKTKQSLAGSPEDFNLSALQPRNPLEENFKVDSLIYFQKTGDLLDVLKTENPILIHRILKAGPSFIKRAFKDVTAEELITKILSHISLVAKEKLLAQLGSHLKDPSQVDEYFLSIEKSYGLYLAQKLLPACSEDLILKCITENKMEVTPRQLLTIIKRFPQRTERIFEILHSHNSKLPVADKYTSVFAYLSKQQPELCLKLIEKYEPILRLTPANTKTFVESNKQQIIASPNKFVNILDAKRLGKLLQHDFPPFFENLFPRSVARFKESLDLLRRLTKHLKSDPDRLKLISETFRKIHGADLWAYSELLQPWLFEMMSPEDRAKWVKARTEPKPADITEEDWMSYLEPAESIPLIKSKIALTSNVKNRIKLLQALIKTCKLNASNRNVSVEVCEYLVEKHRNEHNKILEEILNAVKDNWDLLRFVDSQWEALLKFVRICMNHGVEGHFFQVIQENYIRYRLRRGLSVTEELRRWAYDNPFSYEICTEEPKYKRHCLLAFKDVIRQDEEEKRLSYIRSYLYALQQWNRTHPRDRLSLFTIPEGVESIKKEIKDEPYAYTSMEIARHAIMYDFERAEQAGYLELILGRDDEEYYKPQIILWLLTNKPQLFSGEHAKILVRSAPQVVELRKCRYYSHLNIPQQIAEVCYEALKRSAKTWKEEQARKNAIAYLSCVEDPAKFLGYVSAYYPTELSPNLDTEEGRTLFKTQQDCLWRLTNVTRRTLAVDCVLKFCLGDFLKYSRTSLYHIVRSLREDKIMAVLDVLADRAVSVRKHAIYLAFQVFKIEQSHAILEASMKKEKNASMRKSLFKAIFKSFLRNASDSAWHLTKANLLAVDVEDAEAFVLFTKRNKVARSYLVPYILFAWEVLAKLPESSGDEAKGHVLEMATPTVIPDLPQSFCHQIIDTLLAKSLTRTKTKSDDPHSKIVQSFVCRTLIHTESETNRTELMSSVLSVLFENRKSARKSVFEFVKTFCSVFYDKKRVYKVEVLEKFTNSWLDSYDKHDIFDEYLCMKFTAIYLKAIEKKTTAISFVATEIAAFCDELYAERAWIVPIFYHSLKSVLDYYFELDPEGECVENQLIFAEGVLNKTESAGGLLLITFMLPDQVESDIFVAKYRKIIEVIAGSDKKEVQVYLRHHLNGKDWS